MMKTIYLYFVLFTFPSTFCDASINSYSSNFGYRSQSKSVTDPSVCSTKATCEPIIKSTTCFGTALPYSFTSVALADDSSNQFEVQDNLALLEGLRSVPRCWAVVQPLLCSLYMPKCENGSVALPSYEMCRITRGPCRFVEKIGWPSFMKCDDKKLFPPRCRNPLQEIKFNTSYKCVPPLVETDKPENWFHEVEGCGIQCQDPFFTKEEHEYYSYLSQIFCVIGLILNGFTVVTFVINWKESAVYPDVTVFYINLCLVFVNIAFLLSILSKDIACNEDGTIRRQHPRSGEHLCNVTFILTYYFLMAAVVWYVIQSYTTSRVSGNPKDLQKKRSYFHISAWSIPIVLSTTIMAMKGVDGDSMSGICFVGYDNFVMRVVFFSGPILITAVISGIFRISHLFFLIKLRLNSEELVSPKDRYKIHKRIFFIGILIAGDIFFAISVIVFTVYEFKNKDNWSESLKDYIVCLAMNSYQPYSSIGELPGTKCVLKSKPSVWIRQYQLFCLCLFSSASATYVINRSTIEAWKKIFFRLCSSSEKKARGMKKHEFISKAFQFRQGHSYSLNSTYDDPDGIDMNRNSLASNISSSFVVAAPRILMRRNAVPNNVAFPSRQLSRFSSASEISRGMSVDSYNQQNLDSQSMQMSEQDFAQLRHQKRKTRKERGQFLRKRRAWFPYNRRGSDTSLQSSLMAAALGAKVTKSTSTGDLGAQAVNPGTPMIPLPTGTPMMPMVTVTPMVSVAANNRKTIPREKVIPPFMHGMDGTHGMDQRLDWSSTRSSLGSTFGQTFTPGGFHNTIGGMIRPPMCGYDMMNLPCGYMGGGMYPLMYPGYPASEFNCGTYSAAWYVDYSQHSADAIYQCQHSLIPLQPRAESASEAEYLPIFMSDSEYTDTGHRSHDEAQLMSVYLMQQERQALAAANSELSQHPKPTLEPQEGTKTKLERMNVFSAPNTKDVGSGSRPESRKTRPMSRPQSGKKTPHSEAPPPSPADSLRSLEIGDDEVFEEDSNQQEIPPPESAQTNESSSLLLKRAVSLSKTCQMKSETLDVPTIKSSISLGQLPTKNFTPPKSVLREKCLNAGEAECLLGAKTDDKENISR